MNTPEREETQELAACPFCGGPPVPIVQNDSINRGAAPLKDDYGDDGLDVRAFVFCHECGGEGPSFEEVIYDRAGYFAAEAEGVRLWQTRDARNAVLYAAGQAEGLNVYPRADDLALRARCGAAAPEGDDS